MTGKWSEDGEIVVECMRVKMEITVTVRDGRSRGSL